MEYRIKMIQKYSGENVFIPQYRKDNWIEKLIIKVIFSPIMLLLWIVFDREKKSYDIPNYFNLWNSIKYNKDTLKEVYFSLFHNAERFCDSKAKAEQIIKIHSEDIKEKAAKELEEKIQKDMGKVKKTLYIKVKL